MSATIPSNMLMSDLLKATGYDCPSKLQGKTFDQSTEGDIPAVLEDNKTVSITENGTVEITPSEGYEGMKKVTASVAIPLEDNKATTIDVSAYSAPVEITPTAGSTAMKKCTVSLANIPSGGGSFEPYGCCINDEYSLYIGIFPHGSAYAHKVYAQGKLYEDTEAYNSRSATFADFYATEGAIDTVGNNDLNIYIMGYYGIDGCYLPIEPLGTENPYSEWWYEQYDNDDKLELRRTSDTSVVAGKKYYYNYYKYGMPYLVFESNNKYYGLTTNSSNTLIEIPSQQGE